MANVTEEVKRDVSKIFDDHEVMTAALRKAFRQAILEHRRHGVTMSFAENGKVIVVNPEDVSLPEE